MDGISSVSGQRTATWTVRGKTYTLSAMRLRDYGAREDYILRLRDRREKQSGETEKFLKFASEAVKNLAKSEGESNEEQAKAVNKIVKTIDTAMNRRDTLRYHVPATEVDAFSDSYSGIFFNVWLSIRRHHPEFDNGDPEEGVQKVADLVEDAVAERGESAFTDLIKIITRTQEDDIAKNSNGRGPKAPAEPTSKAASPGQPSTQG